MQFTIAHDLTRYLCPVVGHNLKLSIYDILIILHNFSMKLYIVLLSIQLYEISNILEPCYKFFSFSH